ncbi:MAG: hypothetical protein IJ806_09095 [Ruminococcus sp.]|nr:hypothetical protein [Ruminococcus sp.]
MKLSVRLVLGTLILGLTLSGCTIDSGTEALAEGDTVSRVSVEKPEGLYYTWQGEPISPEEAEESGCIMIGADSDRSGRLWQAFNNSIKSGKNDELTVCTEGSVTSVGIVSSEGGQSFLLKIKEMQDGVLVNTGRTVTPAVIGCAENEESGRDEYFIGGHLVYSAPGEGGHREIPAEFDCFSVRGEANLSFPYSRTFSSYSGFMEYYDDYNAGMGLEDLGEQIAAFEDEGGFNTNVVFLCGDISYGEDVSYEFLRAAQDGDGVVFYLKKTSTSQRSGNAGKWQLICTVPGQYLSETDPENISWVIYEEYETRG